jgi:hypothetical protein
MAIVMTSRRPAPLEPPMAPTGNTLPLTYPALPLTRSPNRASPAQQHQLNEPGQGFDKVPMMSWKLELYFQ